MSLSEADRYCDCPLNDPRDDGLCGYCLRELAAGRDDMSEPPPNEYAIPSGRYFFYIWDTTEIPPVQELDEDTVVITPTFDNLHIYGREMQEDPDEHVPGKVFGEWFSKVCPEGELGLVDASLCSYISSEDFSDAYQRGWLPKGEAA